MPEHKVTVRIVFESEVYVEAESDDEAVEKTEKLLDSVDLLRFVEFSDHMTVRRAEEAGVVHGPENNYHVEGVY